MTACDHCVRAHTGDAVVTQPVPGDVCELCGAVYVQMHVIFNQLDPDTGKVHEVRAPLEGERRWRPPTAVELLGRAVDV